MSESAALTEAKPPWARRYGTLAITLHWVIALLIIAMLGMGWRMTDEALPQMARFQLYQTHKSVGLLILVLTLLRVAMRVLTPAPPLPPHIVGWQRLAAHLGHVGLYGIMLGLPLTGWAMVSASPWGLPTIVFNAFEWPHIPWLAALENKEPVEAAFKQSHELLVWGALALMAIHIGAALKHKFVDDDYIWHRMVPPFMPRR
jgi:cytochrome b561